MFYGSLTIALLDKFMHLHSWFQWLGKHREACEAALKEKLSLDFSKMEGFIDEHAKCCQDQLETLGQVFSKAAEDDTPTEVLIILLILFSFLSSGVS